MEMIQMNKWIIIALIAILAILLVPLSFLDSLPVVGGVRAWARSMIKKLTGGY